MGKLEAHGIRGIPLNWFQSYLLNRKWYVELDGIKSQNQTKIIMWNSTMVHPQTSLISNLH